MIVGKTTTVLIQFHRHKTQPNYTKIHAIESMLLQLNPLNPNLKLNQDRVAGLGSGVLRETGERESERETGSGVLREIGESEIERETGDSEAERDRQRD